MNKPAPSKKDDGKAASKPKVPKPEKPNTQGAPSDKDKDAQYKEKESS